MKKILKILVIIFVFTQSTFAQKYDSTLVSKTTELNFAATKMRGIESDHITYFVEQDLQTISAYESGKLIWKTNVGIVFGKKVSKYKIRCILITKKGKIQIICGNNSFIEVDKVSGKMKFLPID